VIRSGKGESSVGKPGVNENFMADEVIDSVEEGSTGAMGLMGVMGSGQQEEGLG
jgi:hypothetical protein